MRRWSVVGYTPEEIEQLIFDETHRGNSGGFVKKVRLPSLRHYEGDFSLDEDREAEIADVHQGQPLERNVDGLMDPDDSAETSGE